MRRSSMALAASVACRRPRAADLTQEVLHAVARAIRGLDYDPHRGSFRGWLFTVVRNKLRTFWERQARQVQQRPHDD